jgi:AcrR family transcriptional regulator
MPKVGMEEIRRRQLIEATIASIHDVGFSEASVSRIAATAGVSAGIVHHYFEDKGELLEATMRQLAVNLSNSVVRRQRAAKTPAHRLMAVVDVYDAVHARSLYRQSRSHDETVAVIVSGKGTHFDPAVVDAFLSVEAQFRKTSDEPMPA